jgi:hypothetical protein
MWDEDGERHFENNWNAHDEMLTRIKALEERIAELEYRFELHLDEQRDPYED